MREGVVSCHLVRRRQTQRSRNDALVHMRRGEQEDGRRFESKGGDLLFSVNGLPTTGMLPRDIAHLLIGIDETHTLLSLREQAFFLAPGLL